MLFATAIFSLLSLTAAYGGKKPSGSQCSKQLAAIVFEPYHCKTDYMKSISLQLRDIAELYNTNVGISMITSFQNKYGVTVTVTEAFGNVLSYAAPATVTQAQTALFQNQDVRSYLNMGAFVNMNTEFIYSFMSYGNDGQAVEVTITLPNGVVAVAGPSPA